LKTKLLNTEKSLEQLKADKVDTSQLIEMEQWYQKNRAFKQQEDRLRVQIQQLTKDVEQQAEAFRENGYTSDNWESMLQKELIQIENEEKALFEAQTQLQVQAKFAQYAADLKPGDPCPLCGAAEHPNLSTAHDVDADNKAHERTREELDKKRTRFEQLKTKLTRASITLH